MTRAAQAIETGALVAKRAGRRLPPRVAPTRVTRGGTAKEKEISRFEAEAKLELDGC